ncbi:Siroheme synthase [Haloferax massiliensis]|uniref:Siroheme synthase n=1 Tax=Haloferax massiliensis TaxID=1476858 RepID=A0A0D6JXR5_9EURY|nr:Siroheme synthase [Haloferax massiliensis]
MIPLVHDLSDETVVVFGGGPVGARKARRFAREARTVVVSPEFGDRDFGDAELVRAAPKPEEVPSWVERFGPALVVAATDDDAVNDAVVAAARPPSRTATCRSQSRPAGRVRPSRSTSGSASNPSWRGRARWPR